MVDLITPSNIRPRILRPGEDLGQPVAGSGKAQANGATPAVSGDTLTLSASATALPEGLGGGPPIDLESVKRIKEAIAEGKYPIDLDKITESLFQDFTQLMA